MFVIYCSIQQKVVRTKPQKDCLITKFFNVFGTDDETQHWTVMVEFSLIDSFLNFLKL